MVEIAVQDGLPVSRGVNPARLVEDGCVVFYRQIIQPFIEFFIGEIGIPGVALGIQGRVDVKDVDGFKRIAGPGFRIGDHVGRIYPEGQCAPIALIGIIRCGRLCGGFEFGQRFRRKYKRN